MQFQFFYICVIAPFSVNFVCENKVPILLFNSFLPQLGAIQIQVQFGDFEEGKYKFIE